MLWILYEGCGDVHETFYQKICNAALSLSSIKSEENYENDSIGMF